jgi:hypothetical protein
MANPTGKNQYSGGSFTSTARRAHREAKEDWRSNKPMGVMSAQVLGKGGVASKSVRKTISQSLRQMKSGSGLPRGKTLRQIMSDAAQSTGMRNMARGGK